MPFHNALQSITAEFGTSDGREERVFVAAGPLLEPDLQNVKGFPAKRRTALLAPLTFAPDMCTDSSHDIAVAQVDKFRCSQPGLQGHNQDCMVTASHPCRAIRSRQ